MECLRDKKTGNGSQQKGKTRLCFVVMLPTKKNEYTANEAVYINGREIKTRGRIPTHFVTNESEFEFKLIDVRRRHKLNNIQIKLLT